MKKILAILLAALMLFAFAACSNNKTTDSNVTNSIETTEKSTSKPTSETKDESRFYAIRYRRDSSESTIIYVDRETRVMYMFIKNEYGGGLTVMVNTEGKPLLYEGNFE